MNSQTRSLNRLTTTSYDGYWCGTAVYAVGHVVIRRKHNAPVWNR